MVLRSVPFELTVPQKGAELPQGPLDACVCVHTRTRNSLHNSQCLKNYLNVEFSISQKSLPLRKHVVSPM